MTYQPVPIDTQNVVAPLFLNRLRERLAKNAHEIYSKNRFAEGWSWGASRNDLAKTNPTLVPYEDLPESEKEYDRKLAMETIKAIIALGYRIEPAKAPKQTDKNTVEDFEIRSRAFFTQGDYVNAYDVLQAGLRRFPQENQLIRQQALNLNKLHAWSKAVELLQPLTEKGDTDPETWGNLASAWKSIGWNRYKLTGDTEGLIRALEIYKKGFRLDKRSYWLAVNAATLSCLTGQYTAALELSQQVTTDCASIVRAPSVSNEKKYWAWASMGEALVIRKDWTQAQDCYRRAVELLPSSWGCFESSRRNLKPLCEYFDLDWSEFDAILRLPSVVVFVGHMIDRPDRSRPRFPLALETRVKSEIVTRLKRCNAGYGHSSAACGADILFVEAMMTQNNPRVQLVLPCGRKAFKTDSVDFVPEADWDRRFDDILEYANKHGSLIETSEMRLTPTDPSYQYANTILFGLARTHARQLDTEFVPLAVWDGERGDGPGGTADTVTIWQKTLARPIEFINIKQLMHEQSIEIRPASGEAPTVPAAPACSVEAEDVKIMSLLFADVVGYSKLPEVCIPIFIQKFMGRIASLLSQSGAEKEATNTWGDAIYCVFADVERAGLTALELCRTVSSIDWVSEGLPSALNIRISLHAGPVFVSIDPITGKKIFTGSHVSRAARIEPIAPPGYVYASEAYAALVAAEDIKSLTCEYVGQIALPKKYGTHPLYNVKYA